MGHTTVVKKKQTFTLIHDESGQSIKALVIARSRGGKFMKVWQDTGWDRRIGGLQGNSLKVLWYLVHTAGWSNQVSGPSEVANSMGMKRPNVSHAYSELVKADFLYRLNGSYRLNPYFCWKGSDEQYEQACQELFTRSLSQQVIAEKVLVSASSRLD